MSKYTCSTVNVQMFKCSNAQSIQMFKCKCSNECTKATMSAASPMPAAIRAPCATPCPLCVPRLVPGPGKEGTYLDLDLDLVLDLDLDLDLDLEFRFRLYTLYFRFIF